MEITKETTPAEALGMIHKDVCDKSTSLFDVLLGGAFVWFIVVPIIGVIISIIGSILSFIGWKIFGLLMG